ncbi:acidic repeat-containing protein isoform X2 [Biomphalaria glabrata]|uniref:Peptidase S1 domain-containing protein n=1 Tax=Biomphalaria glabrata TaxID=6526 RepID=A0A2C9LH27_BIOGL|nr:acidic repeat-containing protein isoform X2 [Biomphalaria glabrata]
MVCEKKQFHSDYIKFEDFSSNLREVYKEKLFELFSGANSNEQSNSSEGSQLLKPGRVNSQRLQKDIASLHDFLVNMSDLTGCLLIMTRDGETVKNTGTGFVVKIRKEDCHCPDQQGPSEGQTRHAIVTISTAYHVFKEGDQMPNPRYAQVSQAWGSYKAAFILDYNGESKKTMELNNSSFPKLYGYRLIELDKEPDLDCDWCAIECLTHESDLVESLEGKLSKYQAGLAELYQKSLTVYKDVNLLVIIGHPHNWSKRISIGKTTTAKEELRVVRSNQIWCRYYYDSLTCKGSSGAPIFKWGQPISGFGHWFGHPHNHVGKFGLGGKSTIGVENII